MRDPFTRSYAPPPLATLGPVEKPQRLDPADLVRAAARALHLPQEAGTDIHHYVGTAPVAYNQATVEAVSRLSRSSTYSFAEYLDAVRHIGGLRTRWLREQREWRKTGDLLQQLTTLRDRAFLSSYSVDAFTSDLAGYETYLRQVGDSAILDHSVPVFIPESARRQHTYLVGATGYGKTELLKALIHSYVTEPSAAVVVIDPAGDFVQQLARWPEFVGSDRLVYFHPTLGRGVTPTINPLQTPFASDTSEKAVRAKQVIAQQLLAAFEQVIAGGLGSAVSLPMRALLMPCILTLLDRPGSTLLDLYRFMDDGGNLDLIEFGASRRHYPAVASFFHAGTRERGFRDKRFNITKGSILTKLQELFNSGFFVDLTCGESTIDLSGAIERRKIILFNLAKGNIGDDESQAFGRLIVALLQGMAMREGRKRVPTHLFIDECHNFVTPAVRTILLEARKFRLYLTLAQQIVGEGMSAEMRHVITGSANCHVTGYAQSFHQGDAARLVGVPREEVAGLDKGDFYIRVGRNRAFRFRGRSDLLGASHAMTPSAWKRLVARQLRTYYRPRVSPPEPPEPEPVVPHDDGFDDRAARWE